MKTISGLAVLLTGIAMVIIGIGNLGNESAFIFLALVGLIVSYAGYRILQSD